MPRLKAIEPDTAEGKAKQLLDEVNENLGTIPLLMRTMANSAVVLEAYLGLSEALANGTLSAKLRERIALTVAETNDCQYCLAAHTALGNAAGLSTDDVLDSRRGVSPDRKVEVALRFARKVVETHGSVSDEDVSRLRDVGYGDSEIAEIVANIALNIFSNYFNHVAGTELDFPRVCSLADGVVIRGSA